MTIWFNQTFDYTGCSWDQFYDGFDSNFGPGYGEFQVYNRGGMYWAFDMRSFAKRYPGYNLSALRMQLIAKSHSGAHTIGYNCYPLLTNLGDFRQYPSQYGDAVRLAGANAGGARNDWWNNPSYKTHEWGALNQSIPFSKLEREPLIIKGDQMQPNRWASVYNCRIVALEAWRQSAAFPGKVSDALIQNDFIHPGAASQLMGAGHRLTEFTSIKEYLGQRKTPPFSLEGWTYTGGRWGVIPGSMWGGTSGYGVFNFPRRKRIKAIKIQIQIYSKNGNFHGTGGYFGSANPREWSAGPWEGVQVSPWLACNAAPGEPVIVHGFKGNSDQGDGANYGPMYIVDVMYE